MSTAAGVLIADKLLTLLSLGVQLRELRNELDERKAAGMTDIELDALLNAWMRAAREDAEAAIKDAESKIPPSA